MFLRRAALALALAAGLRAAPAPLVSVLGTCSALTSNTYPADSVNWFDASRHSQVVFYAHLLYPVQDTEQAWHAPLVWPPSPLGFQDEFHAEAEWLDPQGQRIAFHSLTFPARIRADWLRVNGADYVPHTLAMAIGTRDLRAEAGQTRLPDQIGQYTVKLRLDGRDTALAFFRMLSASDNKKSARPEPGAQGLTKSAKP
jgi:hypothetical protein